MKINFTVYYSLLLLTNIIALGQWKRLSAADRWFAILLVVTLAEECSSYIFMKLYRHNLEVYHVLDPIEFLLISLYFNDSIAWLQRKRIGLLAGIAVVILGLINTIFIQGIHALNSNFLLLEALAIIIYCLLSFHQILMDETQLPYRYTHFWISVCLILYWGITFTGWGLYNSMIHPKDALHIIFSKLLEASSYIFYLGLAIIFFRYKRLIPSGTNA